MHLSDYSDRHNITEHHVFLSKEELMPPKTAGDSMLSYMIFGYDYDFDFIMLNQIMFTFRRQNGYMMNNQTNEYWAWHKETFKQILLHPKYDFAGNYFACFIATFITKINRLLGMVIGFMTLSFINGLAIRVAVLSSNVIIFPLMWIIKVVIGQEMTYG